jgi:hypothetical protein
VSLLQVLEGKRQNGDFKKILIRAQRAKFMESGDEVLFISIAHSLRLRTKMNRCVSLGLRVDNALKRKVKFLNDPQIPVIEVNQTCERCPLENSQCSERTVPPSVYIREEQEELLNKRLKQLVTDYRGKNLKI